MRSIRFPTVFSICLAIGCVLCQGPTSRPDESTLKQLKSCLARTDVEVSYPWNETWWYDSQSVLLPVLRRPIAVAYAAYTSQVQDLVKCANKHKVKVSPRSGGHSYEAFCNEDDHLVIDVSRIDFAIIGDDNRTATVGAGIRLGRLYYELGKQRKTFPAGQCTTLGLAGHVGAGGYGFLARMWGLAADNVLELEVVDYRGRVLVANNRTNEDLFFALRGGGGGSYGIITKMKLRIYADPPLTTAFTIRWNRPIPASEFSEAWFKWRPWQSMPREMTVAAVYSKATALMGMYIGDDGRAGLEHYLHESRLMQLGPVGSQKYEYFSTDNLLDARAWIDNGNVHYGNNSDYEIYNVATSYIFDRLNLPPFPVPVHPTWATIQNDTRVNATHADHDAQSTGPVPDQRALRIDREYIKYTTQFFADDAEFDEAAYDALDTYLSHEGTGIALMPLGGIFSTTADDFNAFPNRKETFFVEYETEFVPTGTNLDIDRDKQYHISRTILQAMEPYSNHRSYQGGPDLIWTTDPTIYMPRYYGGNVERLVRAKATYDPHDLFSYQQSTPTHYT